VPGEGHRAGAPGERAVSEGSGDAEHLFAEGGHHHTEAGGALGADGCVHPVHLAVEVGLLVAGQRHQDTQILAQMSHRLVVAQAEHALDDDLVAQADAQREAVARRGGHRVGLLGDGVRMARKRRHH